MDRCQFINGIGYGIVVLGLALPADRSSIELGTENQTKLAGVPVRGPLYTFAPAIDQFLKGHLLGDIFGRDRP